MKAARRSLGIALFAVLVVLLTVGVVSATHDRAYIIFGDVSGSVAAAIDGTRYVGWLADFGGKRLGQSGVGGWSSPFAHEHTVGGGGGAVQVNWIKPWTDRSYEPFRSMHAVGCNRVPALIFIDPKSQSPHAVTALFLRKPNQPSQPVLRL